MGEPSVQLLQDTGVPLAQVSEQSRGEKRQQGLLY